MHSERKRRSLYKTISFRAIAFLITFTIVYLWTGEFTTSVSLTVILNVTKAIAYYLHERFWDKAQWGKVAEDKKS